MFTIHNNFKFSLLRLLSLLTGASLFSGLTLSALSVSTTDSSFLFLGEPPTVGGASQVEAEVQEESEAVNDKPGGPDAVSTNTDPIATSDSTSTEQNFGTTTSQTQTADRLSKQAAAKLRLKQKASPANLLAQEKKKSFKWVRGFHSTLSLLLPLLILALFLGVFLLYAALTPWDGLDQLLQPSQGVENDQFGSKPKVGAITWFFRFAMILALLAFLLELFNWAGQYQGKDENTNWLGRFLENHNDLYQFTTWLAKGLTFLAVLGGFFCLATLIARQFSPTLHLQVPSQDTDTLREAAGERSVFDSDIAKQQSEARAKGAGLLVLTVVLFFVFAFWLGSFSQLLSSPVLTEENPELDIPFLQRILPGMVAPTATLLKNYRVHFFLPYGFFLLSLLLLLFALCYGLFGGGIGGELSPDRWTRNRLDRGCQRQQC